MRKPSILIFKLTFLAAAILVVIWLVACAFGVELWEW